MRFEFMILDVFSNAPFGGNQLAVLTDARGLSCEGMQAVAAEFNFAETAFVLPSRLPECVRRVRIFTPRAELSFAGHPTVGTACALALSGRVSEPEFVLEEAVGPVRLKVTKTGGLIAAAFSLERQPEFLDDVPSSADMARVLSLGVADILEVFCAGVGLDFTFVQLRERAVVDRSRVDPSAWAEVMSHRTAPQTYVFAGSLEAGGEYYGRMFAPNLGIPEDPATGAAVAALAAVAGLRSSTAGVSLDVSQGVAMGRPSRLAASARGNGTMQRIEVGGSCVPVAEGQFDVPQKVLE